MFNYNKCRERVRLQKHSAKQFKSILFLKLPSLHGFFMPFLGETATSAPGFHIFRGHHKFSDITRVKSVSELSCQKDSGVRKTFKFLYFEDHKQCNSVTFRFFFLRCKIFCSFRHCKVLNHIRSRAKVSFCASTSPELFFCF